MKKKIMNTKFIFIILIIVVSLVGFSFLALGRNDPVSILPNFERQEEKIQPKEKQIVKDTIVPEKVGLYLRRSYDERKDIVLELSVFAGGGCDQVSDLKVATDIGSESISVTIDGYTIDKYTGSDDCIAVIAEAKSQIVVTDFIKSGGGEVIFTLGGEVNKYAVRSDGESISLDPVSVTNVISHTSGSNQPQKAQSLVIESE